MLKLLQRIRDDEDGATMVEYALMIAFVAVVVFVAVQLFGAAIQALFQLSSDAVEAALN